MKNLADFAHQPSRPSPKKQKWILLLFVPALLLVAFWFFSQTENQEENNEIDHPSMNMNDKPSDLAAHYHIPSQEEKIRFILPPGEYIAGVDIPVGIYDVKALRGSGYVTTDLYEEKGGFSAMMSPKEKEYSLTEYAEVALLEQRSLHINNVEIEIVSHHYIRQNIQRNPDIDETYSLSKGDYVIGVDISAGTYDIRVEGNDGSFFLESNNNVIGDSYSPSLAANQEYGILREIRNIHIGRSNTVSITGNVVLHFTPSSSRYIFDVAEKVKP